MPNTSEFAHLFIFILWMKKTSRKMAPERQQARYKYEERHENSWIVMLNPHKISDPWLWSVFESFDTSASFEIINSKVDSLVDVCFKRCFRHAYFRTFKIRVFCIRSSVFQLITRHSSVQQSLATLESSLNLDDLKSYPARRLLAQFSTIVTPQRFVSQFSWLFVE